MDHVSCSAWRWRRRLRATSVLVIGVALLAASFSRATAADVEIRDFAIRVDDKPAGEYRVTFQTQADGTVIMSAQSNVRVTLLAVPVYTYAYQGLEVWKNGRLHHFESSGKENSKIFAVSADAAGNVLRVKANGQEHAARPDVWTTSALKLPDARFRNQAVPLLGCDNGKESTGQLQYVGNDAVHVAGQKVTCAHYRLMREVPHDVWYDAQERLVRQEWVSDGHKSVLELTSVHH